MLSVEKLAVVGWDHALTRWPREQCEALFEDYGAKRTDGTLNDDGNDWDKATFPFTVNQPGMRAVGTKPDGSSKLGVDPEYTLETAEADAGLMYAALGRDKYVRQTCNGFDLGARKDGPPPATLKTKGLTDADKACWCLNTLSRDETNNKSMQQLVELYEEKNAA